MRKELASRIIGAVAFILVLLAVVHLLGRDWFMVLALVILTIAFQEWARICGVHSRLGLIGVGIAFAVAGFSSYAFLDVVRVEQPELYSLLIRSSSFVLSLFWLAALAALATLIYKGTSANTPLLKRLGAPAQSLLLLLGAALILPCLWFTGYIYAEDGRGHLPLIFFLGICVMMDVMAFFSGKTLGQHRLCPNISPNKTVQGLLGGVLGASAWVLVGWYYFLQPAMPAAFMLPMLAVIVAAAVGDLFESLLKRLAMVKDSGSIVYGHGGMFDRIDSIIAAAPVFVLALSSFA